MTCISPSGPETTLVRPVDLDADVTSWFDRRASFAVTGDDDCDVVATDAGTESVPSDRPVVAYGSTDDPAEGTDAVVPRTPSDSHVRLASALRDAADHDPVPFPTPARESDRLDALDAYDFDAGNLSAHLDGLATAVTDSLDARAGFVGVVDDAAERFVATDGLDVSRVPREESICSYGLLRDDPLVVSDPDGDVRVPDDPLGSAFDVEFYAGVPLRTDDDHCLGMVCALDDEPREFSETDEQALTWFADEVVDHIETRGSSER